MYPSYHDFSNVQGVWQPEPVNLSGEMRLTSLLFWHLSAQGVCWGLEIHSQTLGRKFAITSTAVIKKTDVGVPPPQHPLER